MPSFQVIGSGRGSGRERKKTYQAHNETQARKLGETDGMVVREVVELAPPPPTESQLAKAVELGIIPPADISSEELSSLISLITWHDKKADQALKELAAGYGIAVNSFSGKKELFVDIFKYLSTPGSEHDLVAWFTYRVYRELVHGASGMPITSPHDPKIQAIASQLAIDPMIVQSIRRYSGDSLVWFGRYTTPSGAMLEGGSNRTKAYRAVAALLRQLTESSLVRQTPRDDTRIARPVKKASAPANTLFHYVSRPDTPPYPPQPRRGCLGAVAVFIVAASTATTGTAWLVQFAWV